MTTPRMAFNVQMTALSQSRERSASGTTMSVVRDTVAAIPRLGLFQDGLLQSVLRLMTVGCRLRLHSSRATWRMGILRAGASG